MTQRQAAPGEINGDPVDRFTLVHGGAGALLGAIGAPWWLTLGVAIGWELIENPLKDAVPEAFPHASHDTVPNAIFDSLAMMAGWSAAAAIRHQVRK